MKPLQKPKTKFMFIGVGVLPKVKFRTVVHRIVRPVFDLKALVTPPAP